MTAARRVTAARRGALLAAGLSLLLTPREAAAGNTVHPRTPVLWPAAPCIATIDRSSSTTFAFSYEIPLEDTQLSFDEFEDSRTHQFLGFCRQWPAGRPPPRYVSLADLQRAVEFGFEEAEALDDLESTLETSAAWAGCWTRITADDARRAITYAAASEPVEWDLAAIPAGTWLIAGYTWEPPYNLWSRAPWVLRVIDAAQPGEAPPQAAATIADTPDSLSHDGELELPLCVDAEPGSTLRLEWAPSKPEQLEWTAFAETEIDGPGELALPFVPPSESWGLTLVLRAVVEQPLGAPYEGHGLAPVIVFAPPSAGDGDGDGAGDGDGDGDGASGDGDGDATGTESETGSGADAGETPAGCDCSLAADHGNLTGFVLVFGLLGFADHRRRRR